MTKRRKRQPEHPAYAPLPDSPVTSRRTPPDVRCYLNDSAEVALCLSCAARRRRAGRKVELRGDRCVGGGCADCATGDVAEWLRNGWRVQKEE